MDDGISGGRIVPRVLFSQCLGIVKVYAHRIIYGGARCMRVARIIDATIKTMLTTFWVISRQADEQLSCASLSSPHWL